jgi:hypothetical protein
MLSSSLCWSMLIAFAFRRWWAVSASPAALFGWLYTIYKDVVVKAMGEDAARLQKGLDKLRKDVHLYPEQWQTAVEALHERGLAVLQKLWAAQDDADRVLSCLRFSAPAAVNGGAAAAAAAAEGEEEEQQDEEGAGDNGGVGGMGGAAAGDAGAAAVPATSGAQPTHVAVSVKGVRGLRNCLSGLPSSIIVGSSSNCHEPAWSWRLFGP